MMCHSYVESTSALGENGPERNEGAETSAV